MRLTVNGLLVNPVLGSVRLEKSRDDAAAALTAVLWTAAADTYFQKLSLAIGDVVRLTDDQGTERFLGSVQFLERGPESVTLTAFDRGMYLSRNEVRGVFSGTGAEICRQVASRLGVAVGSVDAGQGYQVIAVPRGENAFSVLRQAAGPDREVTVEGEALTVRRAGEETLPLAPEQVLEVSATADIRKLVDRCVVVDRQGRVLATAENSGDRTAYGLFQRILGRSGTSPLEQAQNALKGRQMAAEAVLLGDLRFRVGSRVSGGLPQWGLEGLYTVTAVCHRWEAGLFTTELTLEGYP